MSTRGRGAGRGVGRGRSRGGGGQPGSQRPGEAPKTVPGEGVQVGRGRGRAAAPIQQQKPPQQQQAAVPPTAEMKGLSLGQTQDVASERKGGRFDEPRTRPEHITDKRGTSGSSVKMMSNYVVLKNRPGKAIYQYNVGYNPPIESKRLRFILLRDHQDSLLGNVKVFDGMVMYLPHKLPNEVTEVVSKTNDGETIKITIKLTNELSANSPNTLQLLNVLFRRILAKLGMRQIGRNYYNASLSSLVPQHKLELWPGFVTSILQYERNVMLCADISHKIMRTDTVLDFFYEIRNERNFTERAIKALVGEIVLTRYNNRTYRIDDINWDMNPKSTFKDSSGADISFMDYYAKQYELKNLDPEQPLLVSLPRKKDDPRSKGPSGPVLLVPQLCTRTGLSDEAREDFKVMRDLAVYTRQPPQQRIEGLSKFIDQIQSNAEVQDILGGWNLEFEKSLIKFMGRSLPPENIIQKGATFSYRPSEADWSREMRGKRIINGIALRDYVIIFTRRDQDSAQDFASTLMKVGPPMGINVGDPEPYCLPNDRTDAYLSAIDSLIRPTTQMVICILSNNRKDRYDAIKKKCCVDSPVPSQCIVGRTLSKKNMLMSVTTKVILQINCKLGGELWAVEIPLKNMMVIGIDTYHDSASKGRSVGGFIASTNSTLTSYYSQTFFQHTGQELADSLKVCMKNALEKFHKANGGLPDRIIVYRDGVGDGQLEVVSKHEVAQMLGAFKLVSPSYSPKLAVVVVKKRINTRLFSHDDKTRQMINPIPGTVVDTEVTRPDWYDFFLVSQSVRQGTVSPTHFNVIYDTSGLKPDHMQRLTYKLTHLYYNWPGTVRVPAPCQYAHKLAFLVGQSIHTQPAPELSNRLYFL